MMLKKILFLIFIFLSNTTIFAQFVVTITAPVDTNVCRDSVTFIAKTTNDGIELTDVTYSWDFDDGNKLSGLNKDTVKHVFKEGGGYIVRVTAEKGSDTDNDYQTMQVSLIANFDGTETNQTEAMCLGQEAVLTGVVTPWTWKHEPDKNIVDPPILIDDNNVYSSDFDYRIFDENATLTNTSDIDTIGINIEHSNLSNLKIELSCPNGSSVILKDFGGADKFLGDPTQNKAYWYYWTNNPDNGTINSITPTGNSMPEGSYTSDEPLANLIGCPLNGIWTIKVTDNTTLDSGYVDTLRFKFNDAILPDEWTFTNTYTIYNNAWSGPGVSSTIPSTGEASAQPLSTGNSEYIFTVKDNFSCHQDTSVFLRVTGASFTADPIEGPFDLEVSFENTTEWATEFVWDFGDNSERSPEENPTHTYTYPDGRYQVLFTAIAEDGCEDNDTVTITVTIPDAVFNEPPNTFSPNNDGLNDFFSLDVEDFQYFQCWIYSRWGGLVKKIETLEEAQTGWDGKIQGSNREAPPGVYYFYIKAVDYFGQEVIKKGSVQLFR